MQTVSSILQPFVQRGLFPSTEKAVAEIAQDYVLRQIERYRAIDERLQSQYGMTYDQFEAYLRARSSALAAAPDVRLNQAVMREEEDAHDWHVAREMLQSWLGLQGEVAA
jgi:hypothetical protein